MEKQLTTKKMINELLKLASPELIGARLNYTSASVYAWSKGLRQPKEPTRKAIEEMYNQYCK